MINQMLTLDQPICYQGRWVLVKLVVWMLEEVFQWIIDSIFVGSVVLSSNLLQMKKKTHNLAQKKSKRHYWILMSRLSFVTLCRILGSCLVTPYPCFSCNNMCSVLRLHSHVSHVLTCACLVAPYPCFSCSNMCFVFWLHSHVSRVLTWTTKSISMASSC